MNRLAFSLALSLPRGSLRHPSVLCRSTTSPRMAMVGNRRRALAASRTLIPGRAADYPEFRGDVRAPGDAPGPATDADGRVLLKSMTFPELEAWVEGELGHKKFRARQLWAWMYKPERYAASFEEMTDLAKTFRAELEGKASIDSLSIGSVHQAKDGTRKILFRRAAGGGLVETVLIPAEGRNTLCFSSQAGCAYNCQFCYTGRMGFQGNLSMAEILDQVVLSKRFFEAEGRISNLVAMVCVCCANLLSCWSWRWRQTIIFYLVGLGAGIELTPILSPLLFAPGGGYHFAFCLSGTRRAAGELRKLDARARRHAGQGRPRFEPQQDHRQYSGACAGDSQILQGEQVQPCRIAALCERQSPQLDYARQQEVPAEGVDGRAAR